MYNDRANNWPAQDLQAVALSQTLGSAGSLTLDGTYSTIANSTISFLDLGFVRTVSLTSTNNLSGVHFTITGAQNATPITETISGPNNNTVYSFNAFDVVSSISTNGAAAAVKAGTGLDGFFPFFNVPSSTAISFSRGSTFSPYAISFVTQAFNGATYSLYQSLSDLTDNAQTYMGLISNASVIQKGSAYVNLTQSLQFTDVIYNLLVSINSANSATTLRAQFLQI